MISHSYVSLPEGKSPLTTEMLAPNVVPSESSPPGLFDAFDGLFQKDATTLKIAQSIGHMAENYS